ncbi:hypothetical protein NMY22_g9084 [Coprinellus aureogranulatus]|nr:hypothetical protein NMY22_g9084 [Coprinellus aureogranulatus]
MSGSETMLSKLSAARRIAREYTKDRELRGRENAGGRTVLLEAANWRDLSWSMVVARIAERPPHDQPGGPSYDSSRIEVCLDPPGKRDLEVEANWGRKTGRRYALTFMCTSGKGISDP